MSYKLDGNTIYLTRGDSLFLQVSMTRNGEQYTPVAGDSIRFALKRNVLNPNQSDFVDTTPIILKSIPYDTLMLQLDPSDTSALPFGTYVYDIEITFSDGRVDTFITDSKFIITREVH